MTIRSATSADKDLLLKLVEEFEAALPSLPYPDDTLDDDWVKLEARMRDGLVLIAEDDGNATGFASAEFRRGHVFVVDLYVRDGAQRHGVGTELLRTVASAGEERGVTHMELHVESANRDAIAFYERRGFSEGAKVLRAPVEAVAGTGREEQGESSGAVHVQTDDVEAVERAVTQYLPRLTRTASAGVEGTRGWTVVRVEPFTRDVVRKLAMELSYRFGVTVLLAIEQGVVVRLVIHEQGRMVDEYLSVPEYYGPLPPGDVLALRANATVVSRLTGADPARVREAAQTGDTPAALPPARELYGQIAGALGLQT